MTMQQDALEIAWWAKNIEELDREIGRLSMLCQVRILDPGVVDRVLQERRVGVRNGQSGGFCKAAPFADDVLRANARKSVEALGQVQTAQIEAHVIEQLRSRFAELLGKWPPDVSDG